LQAANCPCLAGIDVLKEDPILDPWAWPSFNSTFTAMLHRIVQGSMHVRSWECCRLQVEAGASCSQLVPKTLANKSLTLTCSKMHGYGHSQALSSQQTGKQKMPEDHPRCRQVRTAAMEPDMSLTAQSAQRAPKRHMQLGPQMSPFGKTPSTTR